MLKEDDVTLTPHEKKILSRIRASEPTSAPKKNTSRTKNAAAASSPKLKLDPESEDSAPLQGQKTRVEAKHGDLALERGDFATAEEIYLACLNRFDELSVPLDFSYPSFKSRISIYILLSISWWRL